EDAVSGHLARRPEESAYRVLSRGQKLALLVLAALLAAGLALAPDVTLAVLAGGSIVVYLAIVFFKGGLTIHALRRPSLGWPTAAEVEQLDETALPPYTILVPLYHEAAVLPQLVAGIEALDYPTTKL